MPHKERSRQKKHDYFQQRLGALKQERASFTGHYKELSENIKPRRGRFFVQDRNKGNKRHNNIINSKATQAHRTATAGLFAGVMSPARPWFNLATPDPDMMEFQPVKEWLNDVETTMRAIFNAGNLYNMAPIFLGELLLFSTGVMTHVDDDENVARFYTHTVGSYYIAQNRKFEVDTLVRELQMTTSQMIKEFGIDNVSHQVRQAWGEHNNEQWFDVVHFIEPNPDAKFTSPLSKDKRWRSVKYEPGNDENDQMLSEKGFDFFPAYGARWDVTNEDIYGTDCPGMIVLGDVKQLQLEEKRKAQAIDKMVNPPMSGPSSLRNVPVSSLPGGLTIYESNGNKQRLEPIYTVTPQLADMKEDIAGIERRIDEGFFVDLFKAITDMKGIQPRNELELLERNEEALLQLGPVLNRVHGEFLDKLIDRTFTQMINAKLLPEAPPELQGQALKVEFISSLAIAQKAIATAEIDRVTGYVTGLMEAGFTDVADKFDADQAVDEYANLVGLPPRIIVPDERVQEIRKERAQAQQRAQLLESAGAAADIAQKVGNTKLDEDNLASRIGTAADNAAA